jgi:hypothetical protein
VLGIAQHLERAAKVQGIHAGMQGEEDIDYFVGVAALRNYTHLDDESGVFWLEVPTFKIRR